MAVLIPMAGAGSRFKQAGYDLPKPLIDVLGKPMIEWVVNSLKPFGQEEYIFLVQKEHYQQYDLKNVLNSLCPNCDIIEVDGLTEGAACTTLLAEKYLDPTDRLIISNSDQYFTLKEGDDWLFKKQLDKYGGSILLFLAQHPKWSYAKLHGQKVVEVAEKNPISEWATCGIYGWGMVGDYYNSVRKMMHKNIRTNNEFYICPAYNEYIQDNPEWDCHIGYVMVEQMWGLGTPEDLEYFLCNFPS